MECSLVVMADSISFRFCAVNVCVYFHEIVGGGQISGQGTGWRTIHCVCVCVCVNMCVNVSTVDWSLR